MRRTRRWAVAMIVLLAAACGGSDADAPTTTGPASTPTTSTSTTTSVPDTTTTTLDPQSLEGMLAALDTDPSTAPTLQIDAPFGVADDAAAAAITDEMEAALGATVSGFFDIRVFPVIDSDEVLLVLRIPIDLEEDDLPTGLFEALVGAPTADSAGVTMLVMLFADTDEVGPFELTIAVPWSDVQAAVFDDADITDSFGVQITRNGQVVDG